MPGKRAGGLLRGRVRSSDTGQFRRAREHFAKLLVFQLLPLPPGL